MAEDGAGEVGGRLQALQADQAALRERVAATQAALDEAKKQLAAKKAAHEASASANRRAMCARWGPPPRALALCRFLSPETLCMHSHHAAGYSVCAPRWRRTSG